MIMQDEVQRILMFYHGDNNFNMSPHIPEDIEHYARAVLDISDDDYVVAAMRTSFTKFHKGLVYCCSGIYWRNGPKFETTVNHLTWRELSERKSNFKALPRTVDLGDGAVIDNTGSLNKTSTVINMIDLLIAKYEQQEIESDGLVFDSSEIITFEINIPANKAELKSENAKVEAAQNYGNSFFSDLFKKLLGR